MLANDEYTKEDTENNESGFEDTIPRFWNMYGSYIVGVSFIVCLTLFMQMQTQLSSLREEVRSLNRYQQQIVYRDEYARESSKTEKQLAQVKSVNDASLKKWKDTIEKLQADVIDLHDIVERPLKKLKRDLGDLQVKVSIMERQPRTSVASAQK